MKPKIVTITLLLLSSRLFAFQDYDIDGVEDNLDLCPNTSFDILVDKNGCPQDGEKKQTDEYFGRLTLQIGSDISRDETYDDDNSLNLYANYSYHNWDISISNSRSTTKSSSYSEDDSYSDDDIYLSTGYLFKLSKSKIKLSMGSKIVNGSSEITIPQQRNRGGGLNQQIEEDSYIDSRDNDYFTSINVNYLINQEQDIFLYYGYTLSGDSKNIDYENYSSFSIGTGYTLTNSWYTALSYNHTTSIYHDADAEQSLSWFNSYTFGKNIFAMASYKYALADIYYDHTLSLGLGISFE
jgi:hypothetical protein